MSDDRSSRAAPSGSPLPPEFLEAIVRHIAHPAFVKDRGHAWVWVNDAFCALVGRSREELLGKTDHDFFPPEQAESFHEKDRQVFATGNAVRIDEEPLTLQDRTTHVLSTIKAPLRNASGAITHLVAVIHDITGIKSAEEALRIGAEDLEARVEERLRTIREAQNALLRKERLVVLGQLSGGLAHQIRHPLSAISNAAAVLRRRLGHIEDADARQALEIIREEVWEANRIITDLLDFARVRPPSRARVNVRGLVEDALAAARPEASVRVTRDLPEDLFVWVDERQMRDALGNVIRNALEAMGDRGDLTLRAAAAPPYARIAVEDTGPGLNEEAVVHLFEPLVTSKALGLGLGLSTAKALIENQGGEIRYVNPSGEGARFEIHVPLGESMLDGAPSWRREAAG